MNNEPLISFLTPVYNGEKYIRQCIESVLNQTYRNWEYVIINNCSKDSTLEIAQEYAARDKRIRIHNNEELVGVIENHNIAVGLISPDSKYCKIVQGDDVIFERCAQEMVEVAERHPSVGLVSSYRLCGRRVDQDGLPLGTEMVPRRDMCRLYFLEGVYVFGSPTATLIRADLIRKRQPFYREENIHADTGVCLDLLQESDLGFVHQVLSYTRLHDETVTSRTVKGLSTGYLGYFEGLQEHGPGCLSGDEYRHESRRALRICYRAVARCVRRREWEAIRYNVRGFRRLGMRLSWCRLAGTLLWTFAEELLPLLGRIAKPRQVLSAGWPLVGDVPDGAELGECAGRSSGLDARG